MDPNVSYGVYRIVAPSGSCYIGMTTKSFTERWNGHRANFRNHRMTCVGLLRSFEKYGLDAMRFEILEDMTGYGDNEILRSERIWWLRHFAWGVNLYNGEPTGRGSVHHTEETRRKQAEASRKLDGVLRNDSGHRLYRHVCENCKVDYLSPKTSSKCCSRSCLGSLKRSSIDLEELKDLRDKGSSLRILAARYGVSYETIRRILLDEDKKMAV